MARGTIGDRGGHARVLVSNVNAGTVTRLNLTVSSTSIAVATVIASGYKVAPNAAALILGPTGLAYDDEAHILYVASTADNAIFAVPHAGSSSTGNTVA